MWKGLEVVVPELSKEQTNQETITPDSFLQPETPIIVINIDLVRKVVGNTFLAKDAISQGSASRNNKQFVLHPRRFF